MITLQDLINIANFHDYYNQIVSVWTKLKLIEIHYCYEDDELEVWVNLQQGPTEFKVDIETKEKLNNFIDFLN